MQNNSYFIDKNTLDLLHFSGPFITRLTNCVTLFNPKEYLYYTDNMVIAVKTDFETDVHIISKHKNIAEYFGTSAMIVDNYGILLFDKQDKSSFRKSATLPIIFAKKSNPFGIPVKKQSSMFSCLTTKDATDETTINTDLRSYSDYLLTRNSYPKKIQPGPRGYTIGGYYIKVLKVYLKAPNSFTVHNIYGNETDELDVQLFIP